MKFDFVLVQVQVLGLLAALRLLDLASVSRALVPPCSQMHVPFLPPQGAQTVLSLKMLEKMVLAPSCIQHMSGYRNRGTSRSHSLLSLGS